MNSSLPLTLERTSFGFLLFSTAQPIDSDWVTLRRRMVFCLEFCLMIGWRQTAKTSERNESLDSAKCFSHSMEKARERLYIFFDACYLLQFSSDLQTLSTGNVANVLNYLRKKELLWLNLFCGFYGMPRAVETEFPYLC